MTAVRGAGRFSKIGIYIKVVYKEWHRLGVIKCTGGGELKNTLKGKGMLAKREKKIKSQMMLAGKGMQPWQNQNGQHQS